ncbi:pyruvic-ferredoxin oxidoreductase [Neisseria wadsworthii 9715]|uniref:Pyruvic-ferredoxin oxidoreductase n=1 Tax=Neisseria wadsworthii 9715 TaxID=1030841 RepID=G4CSC3_9NEIS|nr:pyruvic-ferredoxin oxidoreductase [Neisseria wadsworthii 9715]
MPLFDKGRIIKRRYCRIFCKNLHLLFNFNECPSEKIFLKNKMM